MRITGVWIAAAFRADDFINETHLMPSFLWKAAQTAVFLGYSFLIYQAFENMPDRSPHDNIGLATMLIALALTAVTFAPIMYISFLWQRFSGRLPDTGYREFLDAQAAQAKRGASTTSDSSSNPGSALKALSDQRRKERRLLRERQAKRLQSPPVDRL